MRTYLCLAALGVACVVPMDAQEDAMSHLLRQNAYTLIHDHRTDIVPGMLVVVNYTGGTYEVADLEDDARALSLEAPYTSQLDKKTTVTIRSGGFATSALKTLIGFNPHFAIKSDKTF